MISPRSLHLETSKAIASIEKAEHDIKAPRHEHIRPWEDQRGDTRRGCSAVGGCRVADHQGVLRLDTHGTRGAQEHPGVRFLDSQLARQDVRVDERVDPVGDAVGTDVEVDVTDECDLRTPAVNSPKGVDNVRVPGTSLWFPLDPVQRLGELEVQAFLVHPHGRRPVDLGGEVDDALGLDELGKLRRAPHTFDDRVDGLLLGRSPYRLERMGHVPNGARDVNERASPVKEDRLEASHVRILARAGTREPSSLADRVIRVDEESAFSEFRARVFATYQGGDYPGTLRLALEALERFGQHRAEATFWAACMHSALGDPDSAVRLMSDGLEQGMWWAPTLFGDSDLVAARGAAGFAGLASESERRWSEACSEIQPVVRLHAPVGVSGPLLIVLHGWTAAEQDMEPLWVGAVDSGVAVAYLRSSQPDTSDLARAYWVDAEHTSRDVQRVVAAARDRLGSEPEQMMFGAFSAGGRLALELAFRGIPVDVRSAITVGAALPRDLHDFPVADGVARGVRTWLLVGGEDRYRQANESLHALLREQGAACRLSVVPGLGHDLPSDLPGRLREAISFALAEGR